MGLSLREKPSWARETKICSWLQLPPAPNDLIQGGSDAPKQCPGHQSRAPEHCSTSGHLETVGSWGVSLRKKPKFPREEADVEPWSLFPLDNRIRAHPAASWVCLEVLWHSSLFCLTSGTQTWAPELFCCTRSFVSWH